MSHPWDREDLVTMTRIITDEVFVDAVRAVLDKRGDDFVYDRDDTDPEYNCKYSRDGGQTGSCLFGAALIDELGLEYLDGELDHNGYYWAVEGAPIGAILRNNRWPGVQFLVTERVRFAASEAQDAQDNGLRYGEVRRAFEAALSHGGTVVR